MDRVRKFCHPTVLSVYNSLNKLLNIPHVLRVSYVIDLSCISNRPNPLEYTYIYTLQGKVIVVLYQVSNSSDISSTYSLMLYMLSGEAANTNYKIFGLIQSELLSTVGSTEHKAVLQRKKLGLWLYFRTERWLPLVTK